MPALCVPLSVHRAHRVRSLRFAARLSAALVVLSAAAACAASAPPATVPSAPAPPTKAASDGPGTSTTAIPRLSPATTAQAAGLVDIARVAPTIQHEIRYATAHNFTGAPINGYAAPKCLLLAPVATALVAVADDLAASKQALRVYDCYRPVRAVDAFMAWARDPAEQTMKAEFYPSLDKSTLVPGYIAEHSGHSRGATLDLTLLDCTRGTCEPVDMGTPFDLFDPRANTDDPSVTALQRSNRHALRDAMGKHGFMPYPLEWWHFTFRPEPSPGVAFDVPVE